MKNQRIAVLCICCFAAGWIMSPGAVKPDSTILPSRNDRPILCIIARAARVAARLGLVALSFAETREAPVPGSVDRMAYDDEGHPIVDHAEGW